MTDLKLKIFKSRIGVLRGEYEAAKAHVSKETLVRVMNGKSNDEFTVGYLCGVKNALRIMTDYKGLP